MTKIGLFEKLFKKTAENQQINGYFKTLNAYSPVFTTYDGGLYEMEMTRAAIHTIATHCSKLKPEFTGTAYKNLGKQLAFKPNPYMDTAKFLYRIATILQTNNNAFIIPILADDGITITGYYPILPSQTEIVDVGGVAYLRYSFSNGKTAAIELSKVGILTQHQYKSDFFGENNSALNATMQMLQTQNEGIIEGVKQSANIRFIAKLASVYKADDISKERNRFIGENLSTSNNGGVLMFDNKYDDVKQIDSKPFIVDAEQMQLIKNNVFNYFGISENILQNKFTEDEWNAFYEGKIEPFALQLSLVMSNMTFSQKEISFGNQVIFTANRLQYASNTTKLNIVTQLFDRGFLTHNQGLEIFNMAKVDDGDKRFIRQEYIETKNLNAAQGVKSKLVEETKQQEGLV